ncbi:TerD family protein [Streptomyces sp. bgisy060]|uniref:TerD family protein n=1 Tax=Streptomyces sp. bgisy060 TaxID=3413775 RepID=UPI003EBBB107
MTAELVRGQNHPLPDTRLEIKTSVALPVLAGVTLGDERGTVRGAEWVAHPGSPSLPGVDVPGAASAEHRLAVDLDAVPGTVHRVSILLALLGDVTGFGALSAPFVAVTGREGTEIARYTITGLGSESAVIALELYRRQGTWKVRAMGQGYEGGLAALLGDQGLESPVDLAASILATAAPVSSAQDRATVAPVPPPASGPAPASGGRIDYAHPLRTAPGPASPSAPPAAPEPRRTPPVPVAGDASGWSMDERLYNQVWGMFEDLARAVAAYRSACDFADSRLDRELDETLTDYRARGGGSNDAARATARARRDELVERAREVLDRDLDQLAAEVEVVEPALPVAYARWDNPVWHAHQPPVGEPMAIRLGDLHLPERTGLRIPLLVRLPLERGLWVDSGRGRSTAAGFLDEAELRRLALESAVAHAARLLAAHPAGGFALHVVDPAGAGAEALAPLVETGAAAPPARGAAGVSAVLEQLTERVDLLQMALRGGAVDALPPGLDRARQLLIVHDFPHGFDERAVTRLRYLADEGPAVGVHLLVVADREDAAAYGPLLDPLWRSLLRLTPVPDDHLADPWVGHSWSYEPLLPPPGSGILRQSLARAVAARQAKLL